MANQYINAIIRTRIKGAAKPVLVAIANAANINGNPCIKSYETLAREAGVTKRTVVSSVKKLQETGYIIVVGRPHTTSEIYMNVEPAERELKEPPIPIRGEIIASLAKRLGSEKSQSISAKKRALVVKSLPTEPQVNLNLTSPTSSTCTQGVGIGGDTVLNIQPLKASLEKGGSAQNCTELAPHYTGQAKNQSAVEKMEKLAARMMASTGDRATPSSSSDPFQTRESAPKPTEARLVERKIRSDWYQSEGGTLAEAARFGILPKPGQSMFNLRQEVVAKKLSLRGKRSDCQ